MKTSKKILSIVLALIMLTTMVTSAFYASACNKNNHDPYKEATTVLDLIDNKLDAYDVDLAGLLDGAVSGKDLIAKGNDLLTSSYINEEKINELLYSLIASALNEEDITKYLESGQWLIDLGNEKLAEILQKYLNAGELDAQLKVLLKGALKDVIKQLPNVAYIDALFPSLSDFDKMLEEALSDYLDGEKLIALLDKLVADLIDGKLIYDENGRKILKAIDGDLAAQLDKLIEGAIGKYVNDGSALITMGDEKLMELLNTYEVLGVPIMQLRYVPNLDALVKNVVLADGSDIMQTAANALSGLFPDVQPTYESIVSCLIPILSAFNFGEIMGNLDNIAGALQLASPTAFAYMAGVDSPLLTENYLDTINSNLTAKGYTGTPVAPLISLTPTQQAKLLEYVEMEKGGKSLSDIADAGFKWTDFAGDADKLDLANAFIKIALGDPDKLGAIAESDAGSALINLLCDLLNDIQSAPVTTILKKLSDADGLSKIADFAMSLLNGYDADFKSYDLFNSNIFVDGQGNTTFYDKLIKEDPAEYEYTGPKAMDQYQPVIAAALDFLSNLSGKIDANNGDILKTILVDKLPQLGNILRAVISYKDKDSGETKMGMIAYLLDDYKAYLQAINASLSDDVLISIAQAAIAAAQTQIEIANSNIATWEMYLAQAQEVSDAAKLAKAKEYGLLDESVTVYDEEAVNAAIETKIQELRATIATYEGYIATDEANVQNAQADADDAQAAYDAIVTFEVFVFDDPFYSDLCDIFDNQDVNLIDTLRADCEKEFDSILGAGKFGALASLIIEHLEEYDGDADTFIDDYIFNDGIGYIELLEAADTENKAAQAALDEANAQLDEDTAKLEQLGTELAKYDNGYVLDQIHLAGDSATIYISDVSINADGEFTTKGIEDSIKKIINEDIAGYNQTIAAEESKILEYNADKAEQDSFINSYDLEGLNLEQEALNQLVDALMVFLGGDESTKSLYEYFEDGQPIEMLVAPDRVNALKTIVDGLITLFGDKIGSGGEYTTRLWEIEDILFGDDGILSTLYEDFKEDPVLSVVTRIPQLKQVVDIVYDMGFLRDIIDQYKDLIDAVASLFGDESEGFISLWKSAYDDGTAQHHYVNAVLSLLPKLVEIYDQVKDIEAVKELIGPYTDIIELVLNLLSKDFYDSVVEDGIVETLLEDENLEALRDMILKLLDTIQPENYEMYKVAVQMLFDQILDGLYQDILVDPVLAITKRVPFVLNVLPLVALAFDFDLSPYQAIIDDVRTLVDDSFTSDWQKSKTIAIINRIGPLSDLLSDVLDVVKNLPAETIQNLLNNLPEDIRSKLPDNIVDVLSELLKKVLDDIKALADNFVQDYHKSPVKTIAKRVPIAVDMIDTLIGNEEIVNLLLDLLRDVKIGDETIGDYETLIRKVIANFTQTIGPALTDTLNEETVALYEEDKLAGLIKLGGGGLEIIKALAGDEELINELLNIKAIQDIAITEEMTVGDIADVIKTVAALLPDILDHIDPQTLVDNLLDKPVETAIDLAQVIGDAIDSVLKIDNEYVTPYISALKNTLELVRDLLKSFSIKDGMITSTYLDAKKPLNSKLFSSEMIHRIQAALEEVADFINTLGIENSDNIIEYLYIAADLLDYLDGAVEKISSQSLFKTFDNIIDILIENKELFNKLADITISGYKVGDFLDLIDPLLALLEGLGADLEESPIMAIAQRIGALRELIKAVFNNEAICNIEIAGYKIGDFKSVAELLIELLDDDIIYDVLDNPIKAIFDRIDYIKAIYEWLKDFGLKDLLGDKVVFFGYNILDAVDILLPVLDKQLYYDFEQSLWKALTSSDRIGRLETALKSLIRFADIFSYSVNEGLCSLISGVCGVLDGLYDSLVLPTTPAKGGNQLHSTSRIIVKKLPAIQNLLRSLKPLLGENKLINLTDIVSDTVKMEKDDILKMIVGVELVKPYYYGISDVLDVVGENAAKYDWNTFAGIIDALNGVGKKLVPALEKALGVSDVKWKDLELPTPEYAVGGSAEDYLVELSGELGNNILTPLVGTLLKAALTIPAIKDMLGEVDADAVAGLLNDLLEFDFKDNKVAFDAFNTEHLILTGVNLVLPKTAPAPSPATADEVVMIIAVIGATVAAGTGVFFTLKKRREEMGVDA